MYDIFELKILLQRRSSFMGERCGERDQRQRRRYRQTDSQTDRKGHTAMLRNVLLSEKFDIVLRVVTCLLWINVWEGFADHCTDSLFVCGIIIPLVLFATNSI